MEQLTRFQKLFYLTYRFHYIDKDGEPRISGIMFILDLVTIPLNLIVLWITNWKHRLI